MNRPFTSESILNIPSTTDPTELLEEVADIETAMVASDAPVFVEDDAIQVASQPALSDMPMDDKEDALLFVQLGDHIVVQSTKYNGATQGIVYYRSLDLIRIKPHGVADLLRDFSLIQTEEEELYAEEDGVSAIYIIEKRRYPSFVEQQDFRANQVVDAIHEDGKIEGTYRIVDVDKDADSIRIRPLDGSEGDDRSIVFGFIGIPPEENIRLFMVKEFVGPENANQPNDAPSEAPSPYASLEKEEEEEEEEPVNEDQDKLNRIEMLGTVEIVIPLIYREAASHEQRIPDHLQKVDALNDFIRSMDPSLQKDPRALRHIRILVETLYLLNKESIEYQPNGEVLGSTPASVTTLAELLQKGNIAMSRPILDISKKLYLIPTDDEEEDADEKGEAAEKKDQIFLKQFEPELRRMVDEEKASSVVSSMVQGATGGKTVIREWLQQQLAVKQYRPWTSDETTPSPWKALRDTEFFRSVPPEADEPDEDGEKGVHELQPVVRGYMASHSKEAPPVLDMIPFGLVRALGPTYRKGMGEHRKQLLLQPDQAPLEGFLLFPPQAIASLGAKRTYHLATDSGRSRLPPTTMRQLLEKLGQPMDESSTSRDILLLPTVGGQLGSIPLTSYVSGLHLPALGWADIFTTLIHYGLDRYELYPELYRMLRQKISLAQDQVTSALVALRQALPSAAQEEAPTVLLPEATFWDTLSTQKILEDALKEYQLRNPTLASSDLGKILYLLAHHDNLFQVTVGKNPLLIAKAVMAAYNQQYVDALRIQSRIRQKERDAGAVPKKNKCVHVADMVSVRRLSDDTERFHELTKVFKRYQGERKGNWFHCNICKEQLLCIHERLQLQAYLHPKEKDVLEKEIVLQCSGGQFQGKYICRNCGQGIQDLDFDHHLEYDDDGRPMSGQAVLEDEDAALEERVEDLFKTDVDTSDVVQWRMSMEEKRCYDVIRVLAERVGIFPDQEAYQRMTQRTIHQLNKLPTRARYAHLKSGSKDKMDYDVYHSRHVIAFCSIFLLLEIQTKRPEYVIRYHLQGCGVTGFDGYPLDLDPAQTGGVLYVACAVSSVRLKEWPWNVTMYHQESRVEQRIGAIMKYMLYLFPKVLEDATFQAELAEKRRYLTEVMGRSVAGAEEIPRDMVFSTFLPELVAVPPEEAANEAILPEVAEKMGPKGQKALVRLWIRRAHRFAAENMAILRGSPFLETTCCLSSISTPQYLWSSLKDMPALPLRRWIPYVQGSALVTHFLPRSQDLAVPEADKDLFYRIFLKYCFQGPDDHIGRPHELNLTNRCMWCGLQFPTHPSLMDAEKEGRLALQDQQVTTDTNAFTQLLDRIHTVYEVQPVPLLHRSLFQEVMQEFAAMDPPPFPDWPMLMTDTMDALLRMNTNVLQREETKGDILIALGPLSDAARAYEDALQARFPVKVMALLREIASLPWNSFFQVIQTYFLTMFQRIQCGFSTASLFLTTELRSALSDQHVEDLEKIMSAHLSAFTRIPSQPWENPQMDLARVKLAHYTEQISEMLHFRDKIRGLTLPGRQLTLRYIQQALFYGTLGVLLDSSQLPPNAPIQSAIREVGNPSVSFLVTLVFATLERYGRERLSYDEEKIKHMIAVQAEKERIHIVKMFDTMTDEERAVEKLNKKLGLGQWAKGGTKVIYSYDKDYYDEEKGKRAAMGRGEFEEGSEFREGVFGSQGEFLEPEGREFDEFGLPVMSRGERGERGGYNHDQYGEDD